MQFTAKVVTGSGRGKTLGSPTLNLDLRDVPKEMEEGVYACWATCHGVRRRTTTRGKRASPFGSAQGDTRLQAALHYGPRTMFKDTVSCEVHLLGQTIDAPPERVTVHIVERLRDVRDFATVEELKEQIAEDIEQTRKILRAP